MARDFAQGFYRSQAWRDCRESYIKKCGGLCEDCLKDGLYNAGKVVHHIVPLTPQNISNPNISLSFSNLRFVCQDCHAKEHKKKQRYTWDANGNILEA